MEMTVTMTAEENSDKIEQICGSGKDYAVKLAPTCFPERSSFFVPKRGYAELLLRVYNAAVNKNKPRD